MRFLKTFVCALLLLTTPTFLIFPEAPIPLMPFRMPNKEHFLTYDKVLRLLDEIENDELEDKCTDEDLDQINHFLVKLAKEGLLPGDIEEELSFKEDAQNLIWGEEDHSEYSFIPAIYSDYVQIIPCKGWVKKKWQKTKKFVKKHKKAIIIGAVVVVAATIIICAVASTAGAAAAGAAASKSDKKKPEPEEKSEEISPTLSILDEAPILQNTLAEQISTFKELLEEDVVFQSLDPDTQNDPTLIEKVREVGALLAHETVDGLSELVSVLPGLIQELREVAEKIDPFPSPYESSNVKENYKEIIASVHKKIDQLFLTDQAGLYSSPRNQQFATGTIPFPGSLSNATKIPSALPNGMNIVKFKEIINAGQKTSVVARELGFTAREIGELKRAGTLEKSIEVAIERIYSDSMMRASYLKFEYVQDRLLPYAKKFMPEEQARGLDWSPSIIDILPLIAEDPDILIP